jgi:nitrate/TMAO reductase-like tetraheme cytochrome c subunit
MKLPETLNNRVSFIGGIIAIISILLMAFFFIVTLLHQQSSNYLGLFIFIILPVFLVIGLIIIPIGVIIKRRQMKTTGEAKSAKVWVIDFTDKAHRNAAVIFTFGTILFLFLSGIGSLEAFHYTETVEFCGKMCHKVMKPEYVAYQNSPHANVSCVECHVGPGADWYVKSKLSGLRQVIAVIKNDYPHPIPTPIKDLRPARETCEQCHWPEKFYSNLLVREKHFLTDDQNTEWNIDLRMKVGASHSALGMSEGIHWHINEDILVQYWDMNNDRETLPYVRYINKVTGDTTVYLDAEVDFDPDTIKLDELRTMDCMDCHNRPSHNYNTPQNFVDFGLTDGSIPKTLPGIKSIAMTVLHEDYDTEEQADSAIEAGIRSYYTDNYPDADSLSADIEQAIAGVKEGFSKNIFPYMKASWKVYPDQIGHMEYNGCFRCHNDRHENESGNLISKDCNLCHTILMQGPQGQEEAAPFNESLTFKHPVDAYGAEFEMLCSECHSSLY